MNENEYTAIYDELGHLLYGERSTSLYIVSANAAKTTYARVCRDSMTFLTYAVDPITRIVSAPHTHP